MAHTKEIEVYLIAKSKTQVRVLDEWLKDLEVSEISRLSLIFENNKTEGELIVESAGRRCYKSFEEGLNPNVKKIRKDIVQYIDNILSSGHGSVLEHVYFSFAIENVTRVFTGEMNRHRAGMAISEGSMRYIRYEDIPYWLPTFLKVFSPNEKIQIKKTLTQRVFWEVFDYIENIYKQLTEIWKEELEGNDFHIKKELTSMIRRIIPMGVCTGGVWTGNLRALRHILTMRANKAAEEEIFLVANKIFEIMIKEEPNFFSDFQETENGLEPKYKKV